MIENNNTSLIVFIHNDLIDNKTGIVVLKHYHLT